MYTNQLIGKFVAYTHKHPGGEPKKSSASIKMNRQFLSIIMLVLAIMILDILTTFTALSMGLVEGNPFMANFVDNIFVLISIKIFYLILIIWVYVYFKGYEKITLIPFFACWLIHALAVTSNLYQMITF